MISVLTVPLHKLVDGPYRNTWRLADNRKPIAFEQLFNNLGRRAQAGNILPIHVRHQNLDKYEILDGHVCADVYRFFNREEVQVICHNEVNSADAASEFYISANYNRSIDWLRDSIALRKELARLQPIIGDGGVQRLMDDAGLVQDLITKEKTKWDEYKTVFVDKSEQQEEDNAIFG